nr:inhibitor of growth protein 3 [Quercus suber]
MPPRSNQVHETHPVASSLPKSAVNAIGMSSVRRTNSGRAIRTNTTRPANYYARPFGSFGATSAANGVEREREDESSPGFFPGLQYFSDAITALPKEVMRQFTLMKEVEAKVHGPNEKMAEYLDALLDLPVPTRDEGSYNKVSNAMLSLTASNSAMGSANPSIVNGVAPTGPISVDSSVNGDDQHQQIESEEDVERRRRYYEIRALTHSMLPSLDEKNVVLAEANRVLTQQLVRIDSVMPHVENEISEEARLGSMTHWAYSDNRQKKNAPGPAARRDMAAANNLVAAASAVHEMDITQARRDAGKEAIREKHKGRGKEHVDSEFEDRPKKTHAKVAKMRATGQVTGLGITTTNGEPTKRRKVDKSVGAPSMERTMSGKGVKATRETPRSTPVIAAAEPVKKSKAKPSVPAPKKKPPTPAQASPALASSPLHPSFNPPNLMERPPTAGSARPQSGRLRQNSSTTNLRHEQTVEKEAGATPMASAKTNGVDAVEKTNGKRKAPPDEVVDDAEVSAETGEATKTTERDQDFKHEDPVEPADVETGPAPSRSTSNSGKAGQSSKISTPRDETIADTVEGARAKGSRSLRGNGRQDSSSSEPQNTAPSNKHKHRRNPSSHLVKQLAPFNRSPDYGRLRDSGDDEDVESLNGQEQEDAEGSQSRRSRSRRNTLASKRNTATLDSPVVSVPPTREHEDPPLDAEPPPTPARTRDAVHALADEAVPSLEADDGPDDISSSPASPLSQEGEEVTAAERLSERPEDDDEDSEHDPDDPNEPKYCYCNRGSYGEMVACDNDDCAREWFHLGCTELRRAPAEEEKWFCVECRPLFFKNVHLCLYPQRKQDSCPSSSDRSPFRSPISEPPLSLSTMPPERLPDIHARLHIRDTPIIHVLQARQQRRDLGDLVARYDHAAALALVGDHDVAVVHLQPADGDRGARQPGLGLQAGADGARGAAPDGEGGGGRHAGDHGGDGVDVADAAVGDDAAHAAHRQPRRHDVAEHRAHLTCRLLQQRDRRRRRQIRPVRAGGNVGRRRGRAVFRDEDEGGDRSDDEGGRGVAGGVAGDGRWNDGLLLEQRGVQGVRAGFADFCRFAALSRALEVVLPCSFDFDVYNLPCFSWFITSCHEQ